MIKWLLRQEFHSHKTEVEDAKFRSKGYTEYCAGIHLHTEIHNTTIHYRLGDNHIITIVNNVHKEIKNSIMNTEIKKRDFYDPF